MTYKCNNCKHEWIPRTNEKPKKCPKCKSKKWDENKNINIDLNKSENRIISEQDIINARKIVDEWEATHGGPGSLRRSIEQQSTQVQP